MPLNESIVEDAALEWFGELCYAVGHGAAFVGLRRAKASLAPGEPAAERGQECTVEHRTPNIQRRSEERRARS